MKQYRRKVRIGGGGNVADPECSIRRFLRKNVFLLVLLKVGGVRGQTVVSSPMRPGSTGPVMKAGVRSAVVKQATMVLDDV